MSSMPEPPEPQRRKWTVPILLGALALAVLLVVCVAGSAAAFLAFRSKSPQAALTPPPSSAPPAPAPAPQSSKSPAECLIGDWLEVSVTSDTNIYGASVQLTGKGSVVRYTADGRSLTVLENVVLTGSAQGDSYEVIHDGTMKLNYVADDKTLNYSNPEVTGTTTWKVNGKVKDTEPIRASLKPETYRCQGNDLRTFSETSASELKRIVGPGTNV